jgi:transcriptional regulator with XRE-family HTH domain
MSLARKTGLSNSLISQFLKGKRSAGLNTFIGLSIAYKIPIGALISHFADIPLEAIQREMPVIRSSSLRNWKDINDFSWLTTNNDGYLMGISDDESAFWVSIEHGFIDRLCGVHDLDLLLVEPFKGIVDDCMVLARDNSQRWFIARYYEDGDKCIFVPKSLIGLPSAICLDRKDINTILSMPVKILIRRSV